MQIAPLAPPDGWRHNHLGHWLRLSLERFDARVMALMAQHPGVSLGLSNLAARSQLAAAHWHISRHLPPEGARLTELAQRAGLPMPRVFVIESPQPNAFATGRNPENAAVAATTGLLRLLDRDEIAGVMARELNWDHQKTAAEIESVRKRLALPV